MNIREINGLHPQGKPSLRSPPSAVVVLRRGYKEVKTVEVCERLFLLAKNKFANNPKVQVYHGSSPDVLPKICDPEKSTTFYLDGHYQGLKPDEQDGICECPIIKELQIIKNINWKIQPYIIIDDSNIFTRGIEGDEWLKSRGFNIAHWPKLAEIRNLLSGYQITDFDDRLYCLPENL